MATLRQSKFGVSEPSKLTKYAKGRYFTTLVCYQYRYSHLGAVHIVSDEDQ